MTPKEQIDLIAGVMDWYGGTEQSGVQDGHATEVMATDHRPHRRWCRTQCAQDGGAGVRLRHRVPVSALSHALRNGMIGCAVAGNRCTSHWRSSRT